MVSSNSIFRSRRLITYQLFIQCNGKGWRHRARPFHSIVPHGWAVRWNGAGIRKDDVTFRGHRLGRESTVGIYTQFDLGWGEMPADVRQQLQFLFKVNGALFLSLMQRKPCCIFSRCAGTSRQSFPIQMSPLMGCPFAFC